MAARIMDTALPGQILASASTVVPNLSMLLAEELATEDLLGAHYDHHGHQSSMGRAPRHDCACCPRMQFDIATEASEVVVKHGVTSNVQSITCSLHPLPRPGDLPPEFQPGYVAGGGGGGSGARGSESGSEPAAPVAAPNSGEGEGLMSRFRKNPKKQSFASLSSLQPSGNSSVSLSLRNTLLKRRSGSSTDSTTKSQVPGRNASWKLSGSFKAQDRLSLLSQLTMDDRVHPPPLAASPTATSDAPQLLRHKQPQQKDQESSQVVAFSGPQHVGNHRTPATKWYMKIKPTEMQSSSNNQIKPKVLPQELIRRHKRIAFLGIMHDNLSRAFANILEADPSHRWEQVYILFPSDECLRNNLARNYRDQPVHTLVHNKWECRRVLLELLSPVVEDLRFLQYEQLMHCGSYWDWRDPGGFIHVSPLTWGANPKTCPAMNYYWNSRVPSPEYRVYREGLEYLLGTARQFEDAPGSLLEDGRA